jgi:hypothetical protein
MKLTTKIKHANLKLKLEIQEWLNQSRMINQTAKTSPLVFFVCQMLHLGPFRPARAFVPCYLHPSVFINCTPFCFILFLFIVLFSLMHLFIFCLARLFSKHIKKYTNIIFVTGKELQALFIKGPTRPGVGSRHSRQQWPNKRSHPIPMIRSTFVPTWLKSTRNMVKRACPTPQDREPWNKGWAGKHHSPTIQGIMESWDG